MFGISPITPAFGRDYRSKKAVLEDFDADKDFLSARGQPINKSQIKEEGIKDIQVRFGKLRKTAMLEVS